MEVLLKIDESVAGLQLLRLVLQVFVLSLEDFAVVMKLIEKKKCLVVKILVWFVLNLGSEFVIMESKRL